jgi:hypothetical protein
MQTPSRQSKVHNAQTDVTYSHWSYTWAVTQFLCAFAKLRIATIRCVLSVCPSAWEQLGCHWTDIREICLSIFRKSVERIQLSLQYDNDYGHFTWPTMYICDNIWLNCAWKEKCFKLQLWRRSKHFFFSINVFWKSCRLWDNVEKYRGAGQATDDSMAHAHCMLDTYGCKRTLRICNTYCVYTATIVMRTRLIVTLYVHYLVVVNVVSVCNLVLDTTSCRYHWQRDIWCCHQDINLRGEFLVFVLNLDHRTFLHKWIWEKCQRNLEGTQDELLETKPVVHWRTSFLSWRPKRGDRGNSTALWPPLSDTGTSAFFSLLLILAVCPKYSTSSISMRTTYSVTVNRTKVMYRC